MPCKHFGLTQGVLESVLAKGRIYADAQFIRIALLRAAERSGG